jgi:hypothetical protein
MSERHPSPKSMKMIEFERTDRRKPNLYVQRPRRKEAHHVRKKYPSVYQRRVRQRASQDGENTSTESTCSSTKGEVAGGLRLAAVLSRDNKSKNSWIEGCGEKIASLRSSDCRRSYRQRFRRLEISRPATNTFEFLMKGGNVAYGVEPGDG